jgi:hypothetical protein
VISLRRVGRGGLRATPNSGVAWADYRIYDVLLHHYSFEYISAVTPEKGEAAWLEKAVLAAIIRRIIYHAAFA